MRKLSVFTVLISLALASDGWSQSNSVYSARDFGAKGDGATDDTAAIQKALDAAGHAGGGTVLAGRGNYFFAGHLSVPRAVALTGIWKSVPSHIGIRNTGAPKPTDDGTSFLVTENEGKEDGPGFNVSGQPLRRGVYVDSIYDISRIKNVHCYAPVIVDTARILGC